MKLSETFVDFFEDLFISGLELNERSTKKFKEEFRNNPEEYLASLVLVLKEKEMSDGWFAADILYEIKANLKKAREFLQEKSIAR